MTSHCGPKGTECEFDILQPRISHQLMHCNKLLRLSLKAHASKTYIPVRSFCLQYQWIQFMKMSACGVFWMLLLIFIGPKVLVSRFAMPILHWINVLSKVLKSKTVYYFIMWKKYTHLNLMLCVALWFMSHTKNHSPCVSQIQTEISNDYMKWSNIICCILPIINIYHIPSHLINSLRHNGELNYSKIITALQIIPYSRKQYFIPCTKAI